MAKGYHHNIFQKKPSGLGFIDGLRKARVEYDPQIMDDLLNEPGAIETVTKVDQMDPEGLELFKRALVIDGVYDKYKVIWLNRQVKEGA